jgi:ribonuclease BN (tRNA processing enzyme)
MNLRRVPLVTLALAAILGAARGPGGQPPAKPETRVVALGTRSGPFPTAARAQSSNAVVVGQAIYLIDAGDGAVRRLAKAGLTIRNIDAIFLTHLHDDHTTGLVPLMSVMYGLDRRAPVGIYGPPLTQTLVRAALQFLAVNSDIRVSEGTRVHTTSTVFSGHDVEPGVVYRGANVTVRAVENSHFNFPASSPSYRKTKSYSYRVETPDKTIVFSGDTGPSDALIELAKGADLLVTEVSMIEELKELRVKDGSWGRWTAAQQANWVRHMIDEHVSPQQVASIATRAGVRAVVLTHLPASGERSDTYQRYADAVKKSFSGRVFVAHDLAEFK